VSISIEFITSVTSCTLILFMTLEEYIEANGFIHKSEDYYEDVGGHIWHVSNITTEMESEHPETKDE